MLLILPVFQPEAEAAVKKQRTINNVKREQQAAQKSINETTRKLTDTQAQAARNKKKLGELEGQLRDKNSEITVIKSSIARIDDSLRLATATMSELETQLAILKQQYAASLRKMQGSVKSTGVIPFIFSPNLYREAKARYRYSSEIAKWRKRKIREIRQAASAVDSQRQLLASLKGERNKSLSDLSSAEIKLRELRDETDRTVAQLEKESTRLKSNLTKSQQRIRNLDSELNRMIAAEQKRKERQEQERKKKAESNNAQKKGNTTAKKNQGKQPAAKTTSEPNTASVTSKATPEERNLNSRFESNKGRLPFPVTGSYKIERRFGRQAHPDMPNVVIDSPGIDVSVSPGAKARCVSDGTVSGVFSQDGYSKVVMVRHGQYITIYANLSQINVKTGDKVKAGQILGTIGTDSQYGNRHVLHFEIRLERTKLNPLSWIR